MFIHKVETPRQIEVSFKGGTSRGGNQISLLTGPNGSGKTDVLATIADVFHGALQHVAGARVYWSNAGPVLVAESLRPDPSRRRVRVVAQTLSPFSRFPGFELQSPRPVTPIYARGHSSDEAYVCIGFNQHTRVDLRTLALSIVENGIFRLSEQPKAARVALDVLSELNFKDGISLSYLADKRLSSLLSSLNEPNSVQKTFSEYARSGHFIAGGEYIKKDASSILRTELREVGVGEVAEYVLASMNLIVKYFDPDHDVRSDLEMFTFSTFGGRDGMSSEYPVLQAFSLLRRLDLLALKRCTLTPYGGGSVDLTKASSGQQQLLCSFFGLVAALEDEALILIDEPELSLHPQWQMSFIKHLENALEGVHGCHVIIATHSPLIVQAAAARGAEIIQMGDDDLQSKFRGNKRHTHTSVEELFVDVFDTPIPNSLHISNEIFALVTMAESGGSSDKESAIDKITNYLDLYRSEGEGANETLDLLERAIKLISGSLASLG